MRALNLLESYIGYEKTVALIEEILGETVTFESCYSAEAILNLRKAVNERIMAEIN